jgi:prephenate dehydrogenase
VTTNIPFSTICLIGPGLIGGSLALAITERFLAEKLVIWDQDQTSFPSIKTQIEALSPDGVQSLELTTDLGKAVSKADLVILCTPIASMAVLAKSFVDHLASPNVVVTDVGSAKGTVLTDLSAIFMPEGSPSRAILIGGHPMAGSERSGFAASRSNLFNGAKVVLVKPNRCDHPLAGQAMERLTIFWQILGSEVLYLSAQQHDQLVATISHVPHLLSYILTNSVAGPDRNLYHSLAAGGFRDMTRIAQSNPNLWTEILFANRAAVLKSLAHIRQLTDQAALAIEKQDRLTILQTLRQAQSLAQAFHTPTVIKVQNT